MIENNHGDGLVDDVAQRLEQGGGADDAARADLLEAVCTSLEQELEAEQTPAARR